MSYVKFDTSVQVMLESSFCAEDDNYDPRRRLV